MNQMKVAMNIFKSNLATLILMTSTATLTAVTSNEAAAQDQNVVEVKNLDFVSKVHDFGTISEASGAKQCVFKYKNNTDIPIVIQRVTVSCGCTSAEWSDKPIKPGVTGEIKVNFSNQIGLGKFDKSITVYTSSSMVRITLRIKGVVTEKDSDQDLPAVR